MEILFGKVPDPPVTAAPEPVDLTDDTMQEHKNKVLMAMEKRNLDILVVYADREHGTNYGYLTGFEPRFEESVLVLHKDGTAFLMLGNESKKMALYSRIKAKLVHVPYFSLPNQPMESSYTWIQLLRHTGIKEGKKVGITGWKLFTPKNEDTSQFYDVPSFIVDGVKRICGQDAVCNATDLFIHPLYGVRIQVNANEIAHYEYGSSLASFCIYQVINNIEPGKTELELADRLSAYGQPLSVQTICAAGERFSNAVVSPRNREICRGDRVTFTMGLRGGLSHRCGYAVENKNQLKEEEQNYLEAVAIPYYKALVSWYSSIGTGVEAAEIYKKTEEVLPKNIYRWELNPGHYTAGEEWMSSPFYPDSRIVLRSGMMLQMDIIINVQGYGGANAEDGIVLADIGLRKQIMEEYPQLWKRFEKRREYMKNILHIDIKDEVLPMSMICGLFRPYLLNKESALYVKK